MGFTNRGRFKDPINKTSPKDEFLCRSLTFRGLNIPDFRQEESKQRILNLFVLALLRTVNLFLIFSRILSTAYTKWL